MTSKTEIISNSLSNEDRLHVDYLRGLSIIRVMLVHLGLSWFYPPYSYYIGIFFPLLFFISGVVSYGSFKRSSNAAEFFAKRIISILIPFYLFFIIILFLSYLEGENLFSSYKDVISWIFLRPDQSKVFFPIGQIWFIHVLFWITILSIPIYCLSRTNNKIIIFTIALSLFAIALDLIWPISDFVINSIGSRVPGHGSQA